MNINKIVEDFVNFRCCMEYLEQNQAHVPWIKSVTSMIRH